MASPTDSSVGLITMMPRMGSRLSVPSSWYPVPLKCWPFTMVWTEPCGFSADACCQGCSWVPGVSSTNLVKFRSSTGRSVTSLASKLVATSARSVFRSWPPGGRHRDLVRDIPRLQHGVDLGLRVHAHDDRRHDLGLEANELRLQLVSSREQSVLEVIPRRIGGDGVDRTSLEAGDGQPRPGRHRTAGVGDGARDAPVHGLGRARCGRPRHCKQQGDTVSDRALWPSSDQRPLETRGQGSPPATGPFLLCRFLGSSLGHSVYSPQGSIAPGRRWSRDALSRPSAAVHSCPPIPECRGVSSRRTVCRFAADRVPAMRAVPVAVAITPDGRVTIKAKTRRSASRPRRPSGRPRPGPTRSSPSARAAPV